MKTDYIPRLKKYYKDKIIPAMMNELNLTSPMAVPKIEKIVISMSVNEAKDDIKMLEAAKEDLAAICGQMPQIKRAKKSISNFKLRQGMPIALKVTLRGNRMYEFLDRFISLAAPKIRDFSGFDVSKFDGRGSLNIGIRDHFIFPEVNVEKSPKSRGMNITIVTTTKDDKIAKKLLEYFGFPFKEPKK
ncbi:MAG: 50S ribosomal protein L5 [Elusimicrobiales bacterium]|nr:50S ribosomal protein L5 [Elusimicrobiales bacterium]